MRFEPARNDDQPTAVWVSRHFSFQVVPDAGAPPAREASVAERATNGAIEITTRDGGR